MKESEDFIFTSSSAASYEWVENNDPVMFEEIRQRVAEGRWNIVGGWWIQPDCNVPGGESFVRQGLYGQRYFKGKFGVTAKVGYNVDSFGHNGMLPQIRVIRADFKPAEIKTFRVFRNSELAVTETNLLEWDEM